MKFNATDDLKQLWYKFALETIRQRGRIYTIGILLGMLLRYSRNDVVLRRELHRRLEKL
jgi:hypothetical protein